MELHAVPVTYCDSRGFLAAVLKCVESKIGQPSDIMLAGCDPEYPAFFMRLVVV